MQTLTEKDHLILQGVVIGTSLNHILPVDYFRGFLDRYFSFLSEKEIQEIVEDTQKYFDNLRMRRKGEEPCEKQQKKSV